MYRIQVNCGILLDNSYMPITALYLTPNNASTVPLGICPLCLGGACTGLDVALWKWTEVILFYYGLGLYVQHMQPRISLRFPGDISTG